jgi:hypothetical protein
MQNKPTASGLTGRVWGPEAAFRDQTKGPFAVLTTAWRHSGWNLRRHLAAEIPLVRAATMKTDWTLSASFEHFGAVRPLRHFAGSAVSNDGRTVVVAMWADEIVRQDDHVTYHSLFGPPLKGKSRKVSLQWITHLKWAIKHCKSCVRVVVLTAEDTQTHPRVIRSCYPDDTLVMHITSFNAKTGCFEARTP